MNKKQSGGVFVSDEKAVTLDYDMMPNIVDVKLVPWFETAGIAEAVRNYKNGETAAVYSEEQEQQVISESMQNLFEGIAAVTGIDLGAIAAPAEGGN